MPCCYLGRKIPYTSALHKDNETYVTMMETIELYERYKETGAVSTDTRRIIPGSLFFALKGPKFNANEFAAEALKKGARYAVVDDPGYATDARIFVVDDALLTLQQLAQYHRSQLSIPIIALTGSNGKTTSKELLHAVLGKKFKTHATKGNLNNHIGVPLTVLEIDASIEIAIVEMGANHLGEIARLCEIANPTHGFITNIGKAHIGTFGGFDNIVRGKSELLQHLLSYNGIAFINSQNPLLANMARRFSNPVLYPSKGDYYHCQLVDNDLFLTLIAQNEELVKTHLVGAYNFENAAVALCLGKYFGVTDHAANEAIASYQPANMRSQVVEKGSNQIILDAYNANPSSMAAAIENLARLNVENKTLILGDMFELEEDSEKEHRAIGRLIREKGFMNVYLCGALFQAALTEIPLAHYFEKKELLIEALKKNPIQQSTILIKASRGIGLEAVVEIL